MVLALVVVFSQTASGHHTNLATARETPVAASVSTSEAATTTTVPTPSTASPTPPTMPATTSTTGPAIENGTIRGQAVDESGAPLTGIFVYPDAVWNAVATTDRDGRYEIPCVLNGYPVSEVVLSGTGPTWARGTGPEQNWATAKVGQDEVSCSADPSTLPVVTTMQRGVMITGLVKNDKGEPLRNAELLVGVADPISHLASESVTDENGRYWIYGVPAGEIHMDNNGLHQITFTGTPDEIVAVDWPAIDDAEAVYPGTMP